MGVVDTVSVLGCFKSIGLSTNFQIPKSLSFVHSKSKSPIGLCNFRCSSLSSSRFSVSDKALSPDNFKNLDMSTLKDVSISLANLLYNDGARQILFVTVVLLDEDRQLKQRFDELVLKARNENDPGETANIVLNVLVPLLLENADRWISSRLMVTSNFKEASLKLRESEQMITDKFLLLPDGEEAEMDTAGMEAKALNTIRCTEVFVNVCIVGVIDDKFREIHTREDLKCLLQHLMSMENVVAKAAAFCLPALVLKEKTKVLEEYSHSTT